MKDEDDKTKLGLIGLWLLLLLILLGGINNAFYRSDTNLDISNIVFPLACYARTPQTEPPEGAGQARTSQGTGLEEKGIPRDESLEPLIQKYSEQYNVNPDLVRCIVWKESSNNPGVVSNNGLWVGLAQFTLGTWKSFRAQMGESQTDTRTNPEHAIETLSWALSQGLQEHWPTYRLCY